MNCRIRVPVAYFCRLPRTNRRTVIFARFIIHRSTRLLCNFGGGRRHALFGRLVGAGNINPGLTLTVLSKVSTRRFIGTIRHRRIKTLIGLPNVNGGATRHLVIRVGSQFGNLRNSLFAPTTSLMLASPTDPTASSTRRRTITTLITLNCGPRRTDHVIDGVTHPSTDDRALVHRTLHTTL